MFPKGFFTREKTKQKPFRSGVPKKELFTRDLEERPLFQKRRKGSLYLRKKMFSLQIFFQNKIYVWGLISGCILVFIVGVLFGPVFRVKNILISKDDVLTNIEQAYETVDFIRGKNIFTLDGNHIIERLKNAQNSLEQIEIQLDFPSTLLIRLKSYPAVFQTSQYYILSNGALKEKENKNLTDIPALSIISDNPDIFLFGNTLSEKDIKNISSLVTDLKTQIPDFQIQQILYYVREKEVLLRNQEDTLFLYDIHNNVKEQVQQLSILKKESPEIYTKKYIYIDVRIPQKIFLCGYEEEFNCKRNLKNIYGEAALTLPQETVALPQ